MKANYKKRIGTKYEALTQKEKDIVQKEVDKEFAQRYNSLQMKIQKDIAIQYIATVMYTLETWYGWGTKRQKEFIDRVSDSFDSMNGVGFVGKFNADDLKLHIKDKFGIDLEKEIDIEFVEAE